MAIRDRLIDAASRHLVCITLVGCLLIYAFTYMENCFGPPVRADGVGYFQYLPSALIERDLTYETASQHWPNHEFPVWTGILRYQGSGPYMIMYNCGAAVMMLPFYLVGHAATVLFHFPHAAGGSDFPFQFNYKPDGYNFFYQHAAGLAGVVFMVLGVALLKRVLERSFSRGVTLITLVAILAGTNWLHYASGESVTSHPYSFFLFALFLYLLPGWYACPRHPGRSMMLGLVAGLIPLVRTPNALFLLFFPLYGVGRLKDLPVRALFLMKNLRSLLFMALAAAVAFLPQAALWKFGSGHWIANSYQSLESAYRFMYFDHPKLVEVLFSIRGGLLFWSPICAFAFIGFFYLRHRAGEYFLPSIVFMVTNLYLIASWFDWAFGGGFGHRGFVESYAVLALPLAAFYDRCRQGGALPKVAAGILTVAMIGHSLFFMMLYYTRELSYYGLDHQALFDIFWWRKEALLGGI